jgi:hypothetical protein
MSFPVMKINTMVFWFKTLYSVIGGYHHLEETYCLAFSIKDHSMKSIMIFLVFTANQILTLHTLTVKTEAAYFSKIVFTYNITWWQNLAGNNLDYEYICNANNTRFGVLTAVLWRIPSSMMWQRVVRYKSTNASEGRTAIILDPENGDSAFLRNV